VATMVVGTTRIQDLAEDVALSQCLEIEAETGEVEVMNGALVKIDGGPHLRDS